MQQESISPVMSQDFADAILSAIVTDPVTTATIKIALFKNGPGFITKDTLLADFTECDFAGYISQSIVIANTPFPVNSANGNARCIFANVVFTANALIPGGQAALGYFVTDSGGTLIYTSELFPDPFNFNVGGDFLDLGVLIPILCVGSLS